MDFKLVLSLGIILTLSLATLLAGKCGFWLETAGFFVFRWLKNKGRFWKGVRLWSSRSKIFRKSWIDLWMGALLLFVLLDNNALCHVLCLTNIVQVLYKCFCIRWSSLDNIWRVACGWTYKTALFFFKRFFKRSLMHLFMSCFLAN